MSAQLELPVADPAWAEEVEREARREQRERLRNEIVEMVRRLEDDSDRLWVDTADVVAAGAFEGVRYRGERTRGPEIWRTVACRLRDAADAGLLTRARSRPRSRGVVTVSWAVAS